jgi:stage V sporulation protein D (sporulation-specific penicillin-binding protein)
VTVFWALCAVGITARLGTQSIRNHEATLKEAQRQQQVVTEVQPRRGEIFIQDRATNATTVIAATVAKYRLSATPLDVKDKTGYAAQLATTFQLDAAQLSKQFERQSRYMPPIITGLSLEEVQAFVAQVNAYEKQKADEAGKRFRAITLSGDDRQGSLRFLGSTGLFIQREYGRSYPEGGMLAPLLGFINRDGKAQYGLESYYDEPLAGYSGKRLLEKDVAGNLLASLGELPAKDGQSYELTIDRSIQFEVEKQLREAVAAAGSPAGEVVVLDPSTGAVLAMASTPSFDPGKYQEVPQDQQERYLNRTTALAYEPGSVVKTLTMAAAINEGLVTKDTRNTFGETVQVDTHTIHTWSRKAFGDQSMADVLANSDNVAMVWVAEKLGSEKLDEYLRKFNIGSKTGIELPGEAGGTLKDGKKWRDIERATIAFGQGMTATPIQLAAAYGPLVNGGTYHEPYIVNAVIDENGKRTVKDNGPGEQVLKPDTSAQIMDMMVHVVDKSHNRASVAGYKIGGKSGTAQIAEDGGYRDDTYNHTFVGFGPRENPRFIVFTRIEKPDIAITGPFSERTAVPLFQKVMQFLLTYEQVPRTN